MLKSGLVSITFRALGPSEIIALAVDGGLACIEWGGDVHVPHGDSARAQAVGAQTRSAGLQVISYGSYYRLGHREPVDFPAVLETAIALQAPTIRVWAGRQGSDKADADYRARVIADAERITRMAADAGCEIALEYHRNTLTDSCEATLRLIEAVGAPTLQSYWQPIVDRSAADNLADLCRLLPHLLHVHVFHWAGRERLSLTAGREDWQAYLRAATGSGRSHGALLEFVANDQPAQFFEDARTLHNLIDTHNTNAVDKCGL